MEAFLKSCTCLLIFLNLSYFPLSKANYITVYEEDHFRGTLFYTVFVDTQLIVIKQISITFKHEFHYMYIGLEENVSISECSNLPDNMIRNVWSVDTQNNCVRLYNGLECTGKQIELTSRSPSHGKLAAWNFSDMAESAGPCPDACSTEVTGRLFDKAVEVQIFSQKNYKGTFIKFDCTFVTSQPF